MAIKVLRSDRRLDEKEARTLRQLNEGPTSHSRKSHIIQLLDQFELIGPNGRHLCLVVELSPKHAWEIARQLVEATA